MLAQVVFKSFSPFPANVNTSSLSVNQDLTQQALSGAVAFFFYLIFLPLLMES